MLFTTLTKITQAKKKKDFLKWTWVARVVLVVKNPPANTGVARDMALIPGLGRSPGVRYGTPPQYSCLENSIGRGARQAIVHGVERDRNDLDTKQHLLFQSKQFVFYTHPLLPPSPPTFNLSQHQGLF